MMRGHWARFCQNPDEENFGPIFEDTNRLVYTICVRVLSARHNEEVEDAFQGAYARLLQMARTQIDTQRYSDPTALVSRLAYQEADMLRKRRQRRSARETTVDTLTEIVATNEIGADHHNRREASEKLKAVVDDLPEIYRMPILLHYFDRLTHQQIADALGVSVNTISTRLRRGIRKLERPLRRMGIKDGSALLAAVGGGASLLSPPAAWSMQATFAAAPSIIPASAGVALSAGSVWLTGKTWVGVAAVAAVLAVTTYFITADPNDKKPAASDGSAGSAELIEKAASDVSEGNPPVTTATANGLASGTRGTTLLEIAEVIHTEMVSNDQLTSRSTISGRVTDDIENTPNDYTIKLTQLVGDQNAPYSSDRADEDGEYRFDNLPAGHYFVSVQLPENTILIKPRQNRPVRVFFGGGDHRVDFDLKRGLSIFGFVRDESGVPIPGTKISAYVIGSGERVYYGPVTQSVTTDSEGFYQINGFPEDIQIAGLRADVEGYRSATIENLVNPFSEEHNFTLDKDFGVTLLVVDADTGTSIPMFEYRMTSEW